MSFLICQQERCPSTGKVHWQGYAQTTASGGLSIQQWQMQLSIGKSKIIACNGSSDDNITYCSKEASRCGEQIRLGEPRFIRAKEKKRKAAGDEVYEEAMTSSTSAAEYLEAIAAGDPKGFAKGFNNIKAAANHLFPSVEFPPYVAPPGCNKAWNVPAALSKWVREELPKQDRPKCLVLVGESRLGKTQWARSLGRHMYWRGMTNVTNWDSAAKYLIFDDIEWAFIPQKKSLLTCMGSATVTDKYKGKKDIVVDKPAIVCLNEFDIDSIPESAYWRKNLYVVHVTEPLFQSQQTRIVIE